MRPIQLAVVFGLLLGFGVPAFAQETAEEVLPESTEVAETAPEPTLQEKANQTADSVENQIDSIARDVNDSQTARDASSGILKPIYMLAEAMSFPAFHWVAFALMVAGVIGFALQLVLAKLVVLSRMSFSFSEFFSDALGLAISLFGLVLTTQAATENSTFTSSPFSVLSATVIGIVVGFLLYRWGQSQEVQAAIGRRTVAAVPPKKK